MEPSPSLRRRAPASEDAKPAGIAG